MKNCPTCNASLKGARICRRCKTDLKKALEAADRAEQHFHSAAQAWSESNIEAMLKHARRSFSLRHTQANGRLLACAALLQGDYRLALDVWAFIQTESDDPPDSFV